MLNAEAFQLDWVPILGLLVAAIVTLVTLATEKKDDSALGVGSLAATPANEGDEDRVEARGLARFARRIRVSWAQVALPWLRRRRRQCLLLLALTAFGFAFWAEYEKQQESKRVSTLAEQRFHEFREQATKDAKTAQGKLDTLSASLRDERDARDEDRKTYERDRMTLQEKLNLANDRLTETNKGVAATNQQLEGQERSRRGIESNVRIGIDTEKWRQVFVRPGDNVEYAVTCRDAANLTSGQYWGMLFWSGIDIGEALLIGQRGSITISNRMGPTATSLLQVAFRKSSNPNVSFASLEGCDAQFIVHTSVDQKKPHE